MTDLSQQTCSVCEIGTPTLPDDQQIELLKDLDGWDIDRTNISRLVKVFKFKNYKQPLEFANLIASLAESQNHHPKIIIEWGEVTLEWWSHEIKGLHKNDFICAAKSDKFYDKPIKV